MIVTLADSEVAVATMIALARRASSRGHNVQDAQMGKQDPMEIDIDGMVAEIAFGKQFNYYPEFVVGLKSGGPDFVTRTGETVDVKATRHQNGRLLATTKKNLDPCDIYVLAIILSCRKVDLCGYIKKEDFFTPQNLMDLGYGPTYAVNQEKLQRFKER